MQRKLIFVIFVVLSVAPLFAGGSKEGSSSSDKKSSSKKSSVTKKAEYTPTQVRPRYSDAIDFEKYEQKRFDWYKENQAPEISVDTKKIAGTAIQGAVVGAVVSAPIGQAAGGAITGAIGGAISASLPESVYGGGAISVKKKPGITGITE